MDQDRGDIALACDDPVIRAVIGQALPVFFPSLSFKFSAIPENAFVIKEEDGPFRIGALLDSLDQFIRGRGGSIAYADIGPWRLKAEESLLVDRKTGRQTRLTEKERDILVLLCTHRGQAVERPKLLQDIWGYSSGDIDTHTLETHIYRLRQKIETDPAKPAWLVTDGGGYRIAT